MQVVVWIIIILVAIFLIRLLKKWIKRIIFILILLVLAFFIYWIFSPSWAARLRYNVRTFPSRVTSWISNQNFLDYDSYKLSLPSIWDKIDLNIGDENSEDIQISDTDENIENDVKVKQEDVGFEEENDNLKIEEVVADSDKAEVIKSFPKPVNFVELPNTEHKPEQKNGNVLTWYSKSDLLRVINKYVEDNLDDDTNILVTVEYDSETKDPQKIILQTQPVSHSSAEWLNNLTINENRQYYNEEEPLEVIDNKDKEKTGIQSQKNNTQSYAKLSQKDIQDAQEIISALF